jgi:hypothetical protein
LGASVQHLPEHYHLKIEAESVVLAHDSPALPSGGMKLSELEDHREQLQKNISTSLFRRGTCLTCRNWTNSSMRPAEAAMERLGIREAGVRPDS